MKPASLAFFPLLAVGIMYLLSACQRETISGLTPALPISTTSTQPASLTAGLIINSLKVNGVPSENITIDQTTRVISVHLPNRINALSLTGVAKLGCTSCGFILNGRNDSIMSFGLCGLSPSTPFRLAWKADNKAFVDYTVRLLPTGPLQIGPITDYIIGSQSTVKIPVENFYESSASSRAYFYHKASNQLIDSAYVACGQDQPNVLISVPSLYVPSVYRFELVKENGRRASTEFLVQKGIPVLSSGVVIKSTATQSSDLFGINLYQEDEFEILLRQSTGYKTRIKPTAYATHGQKITFQLPADCTPGYYAVQVVKSGQEPSLQASGTADLVVITDPRQPVFFSGQLYGPAGRMQQTVKPRQDISVGIPLSSDYAANPRVEYVFTNIDDPNKQIVAEVTIPSGYFMGFTEGTGTYFTIPFDTPIGRYRITPRRVLANGEIITGITHPRIYEIVP